MSKLEDQIVKQVQNALLRITALADPKALSHFHENVERFEGIDDTQREELFEAIEVRLRQISPSTATNLFGPKDSEARDFLDEVCGGLSEEFNLSGNSVRNGVKTLSKKMCNRGCVEKSNGKITATLIPGTMTQT